MPGSGNPVFGSSPTGAPSALAPPVPFHVEKRLLEMQKQIDELRHAVDALQSKGKK